jgi:hypothetical protein
MRYLELRFRSAWILQTYHSPSGATALVAPLPSTRIKVPLTLYPGAEFLSTNLLAQTGRTKMPSFTSLFITSYPYEPKERKRRRGMYMLVSCGVRVDRCSITTRRLRCLLTASQGNYMKVVNMTAGAHCTKDLISAYA